MFKKVTIFLTILFATAFLSLIIFWPEIPGKELYSDTPVIKAHRIIQDLGGKWDSYPTLRQAYAQESKAEQGSVSQIISSYQGNSIILPSDQGFDVAVKKFKVTGKWGFKNAQFVIEGVYGKARIFLNGIDEIHYLGEFEGIGGIHKIEIAPSRLDFSKENTIYIELSPGIDKKQKIFGWLWPDRTKITGQIRLEAVSETTINLEKTTVSYDTAKQEVIVRTALQHHQSLDNGPWVITGTIKESDNKAAECILPINANGEPNQNIDLIFKLPNAKLWSQDNAFLYQLDIVITNNRGDYDSIQIPLGICQYTGSEEQWVLNGKKINVKAQILNSEQESLIRNQRLQTSYLDALKAKGINVIYFMGFFPDEGWLYAADKLGMGVWLDLPVTLVTKGGELYTSELENLILIADRHPSVMAWTASKGLETSIETANYLNRVRSRTANLPVYNMVYFPDSNNQSNNENILIDSDKIEGTWGSAEITNDYLSDPDKYPAIEKQSEQVVTIAWLICLLLISIQNLRSFGWNYKEIFNTNPKRSVRRAFVWSFLALISRPATVAAIITLMFFEYPVTIPFWFPYDLSILVTLRSLSPLYFCLIITSILILLRLLQVGIAASSFPQNPGAVALSSWLERRYIWIFLVGIANVAVVFYDKSWLIPLGVYALMTIILLPIRMRDVWKVGGKYSRLMIIHLTIIIILMGMSIWHKNDFLYLIKTANYYFQDLISYIRLLR